MLTAPTRHPTFETTSLEAALDAQGFVVTPFFDAAQLAALRDELATLGLFGSCGFYDTASAGLEFEARERVHRILTDAFAPPAAQLLADYVPVSSSLLTKWPGAEGEKLPHRDLRLVDELRFRAVSVWVPLVDVHERNGALTVLPGSHAVPTGPRSVPRVPARHAAAIGELSPSELTATEVSAGDAVVFDMALVHGSLPNLTSEPRPVAAVAFVPRPAPVSFYFCHPDERVEELEVVDPSVFRRMTWDAPPPDLRSLGDVPTTDPVTTSAELVRLSRARSNGRGEREPEPTGRRRMMRDATHQRALEDRGFVVVDLMEASEAALLLDRYRSMQHDHSVPMIFADGFHTTLYDPRRDYRAEVLSMISAVMQPAIDRVMVDYQIQFANFTVKLPDGGAVPEHVDWTFVDEDSASSVTVWCALQFTDPGNGALGVVEDSHLVIDFVRAANRRDYDSQAAVVASLPHRTVLRLEPGQAVVLDNRLVHFSPPNPTTDRRVAAAVVAAPREGPVFHYWFDDLDDLHRLQVEPEFWLRYTPGEDPRAIEGCVADDVVVGVTWG
jgi:ectoine hydroxylase-related dioxygenase (phytanoyl-CoA dioxygenase family)